MPGLVATYDQGPALEEGAGRQGADGFPRRQGHHPAYLGLAGRRVASRSRPIVAPEDAKG